MMTSSACSLACSAGWLRFSLRTGLIHHFDLIFELITGQAAIADLSRGTAQVYNYKKELASYKYWFKLL